MNNRLKTLRLRSRLTQDELGLLTGKHPTLISRQEKGKRPLTQNDIAKYARVFKCETYEIFVEAIDGDITENWDAPGPPPETHLAVVPSYDGMAFDYC